MEKRKVFLVKLPNGKINLIPLELIKNCSIIVPGEKLGIWVHQKTIPGGASDGIGDHCIVNEINKSDIGSIISNGGICFVEVDSNNELSIPRNGYGDGKVVIYLIPVKQNADLSINGQFFSRVCDDGIVYPDIDQY